MNRRQFFKKGAKGTLLVTFSVDLIAQSNSPNAGQVVFYKQTSVVNKAGQRSSGDSTGQFISFSSVGCYDADRKGYDVGNGFLKYEGLNADKTIHIYEGKSYWGEKSSYWFSKDFSRLNIRTNDGVTYVYEKITPPVGVASSAKIKAKDQEVDKPPPLPPPPPPPPLRPPQRTPCSGCNASGQCYSCRGSGKSMCLSCGGLGRKTTYMYGQSSTSTCSNCRGSGLQNCSLCRGAGTCQQCRGAKYF